MQTPSEQPILAQPNADLALCRATIYAALALGFRPPTQETVDRLVRSEGAAALADAARMLEGIGGTVAGLSVGAVALARPDADLAMLMTDHGRLFGHTARGEAPGLVEEASCCISVAMPPSAAFTGRATRSICFPKPIASGPLGSSISPGSSALGSTSRFTPRSVSCRFWRRAAPDVWSGRH
jgi:hypothetical protein